MDISPTDLRTILLNFVSTDVYSLFQQSATRLSNIKKQKFWYKVVSLRTHLKVFNAQKLLISPIQGDVGMKNAHFKMLKIYVFYIMVAQEGFCCVNMVFTHEGTNCTK